MTAFGRSLTGAHAVQAGRTPRARICLVNVGYDPVKPSGVSYRQRTDGALRVCVRLWLVLR